MVNLGSAIFGLNFLPIVNPRHCNASPISHEGLPPGGRVKVLEKIASAVRANEC